MPKPGIPNSRGERADNLIERRFKFDYNCIGCFHGNARVGLMDDAPCSPFQRRFLVGLAACLCLSLWPMAGAPLAAQDKKLPPLRWGADADGGFPYVFSGDDGKMTGFEADFAAALGRELGRPVEFVQYSFESLIPGVMRGDIDIAMNGLEILPDRLKLVDFSDPYYLYQLQLVIRQNETRFKDISELKER